MEIKEEWRVSDIQYECPHCKVRKSKKGIGTHIWRKHGEGQTHKPFENLERKGAWNKGLTKETDERVKRNSLNAQLAVKKLRSEGVEKVKGKKSEEFLKALSIRQSLKNSGGKCKWFEVSGQKVQGTWEYKLALKFEELQIQWRKPKVNNEVFFYKKDDKTKAYTPDFYLEEVELFLEVKGFWWGNDEEKMKLVREQNDKLNHKLLIILKEKFEIILKCKTKQEVYAVLAEMV